MCIFLLISCSNMKYEKKTINFDEIEIEYPKRWKFKLEDNNTNLFFDENLGSFRITVVKTDKNGNELVRFLKAELLKNQINKAEFKKLNQRDFVYYNTINTQDSSKIHFYTSFYKSNLLICSFAYDVSLINSIQIENELEEVEKSLESIKIKP